MASLVFTLALWISALFCHSFATKSDVDTGACVFDQYHEDHELKSIEKIRPLIGKAFISDNVEEGWQFTVGICANIIGADNEAGAIQQAVTADGKAKKEKPHNIGSLRNTHLMTGRDWAYLEYKGGENYQTHCQKQEKRTVILLSCDQSADASDPKMVHIEEETNKDQDCYYLFEMKHPALCPKSISSGLSVGSIFLITFFTVVGLYLLIGFIYQRFVMGSKGVEQIPNYEFWKDLGNLEADGCDFVCRSKGRSNTGFRGIGDDQLDATDELRDDNLLPM